MIPLSHSVATPGEIDRPADQLFGFARHLQQVARRKSRRFIDAHQEIDVDQRVRVSVEGGQVVITPVGDSRPTLEQRLAADDPLRHGGEQMATLQRLGAEHW